MRMTARSSWFVSTATFNSPSVCCRSFALFFNRSSMSSRRRMIAAVACLSLLYFSIIELIAFSYAISGCSFSMSEIQIDRKPRQRFRSRVKNPIRASIFAPFLVGGCRWLDQPRGLSNHPGHRFLAKKLQHTLDFELLIIAGLRDDLLFHDPLFHHGFDARDLRLDIGDSAARLFQELLRVGAAGPDVPLPSLDFAGRSLDDLVDRNAEGLERGLDDLFLDRSLGPFRQSLQELRCLGHTRLFLRADPRGLVHRGEIHAPSRRSRHLLDEGGGGIGLQIGDRFRRACVCRCAFPLFVDDEPAQNGRAPRLLACHVFLGGTSLSGFARGLALAPSEPDRSIRRESSSFFDCIPPCDDGREARDPSPAALPSEELYPRLATVAVRSPTVRTSRRCSPERRIPNSSCKSMTSWTRTKDSVTRSVRTAPSAALPAWRRRNVEIRPLTASGSIIADPPGRGAAR